MHRYDERLHRCYVGETRYSGILVRTRMSVRIGYDVREALVPSKGGQAVRRLLAP